MSINLCVQRTHTLLKCSGPTIMWAIMTLKWSKIKTLATRPHFRWMISSFFLCAFLYSTGLFDRAHKWRLYFDSFRSVCYFVSATHEFGFINFHCFEINNALWVNTEKHKPAPKAIYHSLKIEWERERAQRIKRLKLFLLFLLTDSLPHSTSVFPSPVSAD